MPNPKPVREAVTKLEEAIVRGDHKGTTVGVDLTKPVAEESVPSGAQIKGGLLRELALKGGESEVQGTGATGLDRMQATKLAGGKTGDIQL